MLTNKELDDLAIENFRKYLQIPSVHPNVDYEPCVKFIQNQAKTLNLPVRIHFCAPNKPTVILTWKGTNPNLPSILLNSHMDVVPVYEDKWKYQPFAAIIDEKQNIYGRGTQDMKSVGIQYLEAIRRLQQNGIRLKRTFHICFNPDEEIGGGDGVQKFVKTDLFKSLNVGFALDEGAPALQDYFLIFNSERIMWQMKIFCPGSPGHGSLMMENTAGEKMAYILNKLYSFRKEQEELLKNSKEVLPGDVTTINLTMIEGGIQANVIPPEFVLTIDCRIATDVNLQQFEEMLNDWCKKAGSGVYIEFITKDSHVPTTKADETNPYWVAFKNATDFMGTKLYVVTCPGVTDNRFVRGAGVPAIGFSPINKTPLLLHDNNEYLGVETFLRGIQVYYKILENLGNLD